MSVHALGVVLLSSLVHASEGDTISKYWLSTGITPRMGDICASSGLRLVTIPNSRSPVVTVVTVVDAGSADEPVDRPGVAHLAEHLWFASAAVPGESVREALRRRGSYNGYTHPDETVFFSEIALDDLPAVLAIEGRRFTDPLRGITNEQLAREIRAIQMELQENQTDVGQLSASYANLFPSPHRYSALGRETAASTPRLTLTDVQAFVQQHYRPQNSTVFLIGDTDESRGREAVWRAFPDAAIGVPTGTRALTCGNFSPEGLEVPEPTRSMELVEREGAVVHRSVAVSWAVPSGFNSKSLVSETSLSVLDALMYSHQDSYAVRNAVGCDARALREATIVTCVSELKPRANPDKVLENMLAAAADFEDEHERRFAWAVWTNEIEGKLRRTQKGAEEWGHAYGSNWLLPFLSAHVIGNLLYHQERLMRLVASEYPQTAEFGGRWFRPERAVSALWVPRKVTLAPAQLADAPTTFRAVPNAPPPGAIAKRAAPIPANSIRSEVFENGLTVAIMPFGTAPRINVELVFRPLVTNGQTPGLLDVVDQLATYRSVSISGKPPVPEYDSNTLSYFQTDISAYRAHSLQGAPPLLERAMWSHRWRLAAAILDYKAEKDPAEVLGESVEQYLATPSGWVSALAWGRLFDHNPWMEIAGFSEWRSAKNATEKAKNAAFYGMRQPGNTILLVTGLVDPDEALSLARKHFEKWPGRIIDPGDVPLPNVGEPSPGGGVTVVSGSGLSTVRAAAACRIAETPKLGTLETIENLAATAMFSSLRTEAAVSYNPWAETLDHPIGGNVLQLGTTLAPSDTLAGRELLTEVIRDLSTIDDVARVRSAALSAATTALLDRRTLNGATIQLRRAMLLPTGVDTFEVRARDLESLEPADIRAAMAPCLPRVEYAFVVPDDQVAAAFYGDDRPARRVDWPTFVAEKSGKTERK